MIFVNKKIRKKLSYHLKFFNLLNIKRKCFRVVKKNVFLSRILNSIHSAFPKYFEASFKIFHAIFLGIFNTKDVFYPYKKYLSKKRLKQIFSFKRRLQQLHKLRASSPLYKKPFRYKRPSFFKQRLKDATIGIYFYLNRN